MSKTEFRNFTVLSFSSSRAKAVHCSENAALKKPVKEGFGYNRKRFSYSQ